MTTLVICGAVVVVAFAVLLVAGFNRLRRADIAAQEALGGIDVQLTRRADLVPNLIETVKGYAAHETNLLADITEARTRVQRAAIGDDVEARAVADGELERSLVTLKAIAEAYPELKANTTFLDLQRQLGESEDQVSFARQYYNDAVRSLNNLTMTIPWMFMTGAAGVSKRDFYRAPESDRETPRVEF